MKKLILIALLFTGCDINSSRDYGVGNTEFIIDKIEKAGIRNQSVYHYYCINEKDLNVQGEWFLDTLNAFEVGDTIKFTIK